MTLRIPLLATALMTLAFAAVAQTQTAPLSGIDVIVRKKPAGNAFVVGQTGRDGWASSRVQVQTGEYSVQAACPPRLACRAFRLASVSINGRRLDPDVRGEFAFPVGAGVSQVMLRASVLEQSIPAPR
ncbi:MAG: hypothetical protein Q8K99_09390 [Actinomycetota bacterium]|nr:hypothetical protein [Actinomycetota bacterium]